MTVSGKRKDNKGRVLKNGESQRKDLMYQYRYTDIYGARKVVYSADLNNLRKKESEIQDLLNSSVDYASGTVTVNELLERYIQLKQGVRYNTKIGYNFVSNLIKADPFGMRRIGTIKVSDAKQWIIKLHNEGRSYSTITSIRGVIGPAFQMAYEEECIKRNPFDFKLKDVIENDAVRRIALTAEQQKLFMEFFRTDKTYRKYYDEMVVLLETGMRVSEFCGLTLQDLDFGNRRINVDHQLVRERGGRYYVERTKTASGRRFIPMTDAVYSALKNLVHNRPKLQTEMIVNGYSGFLLIDKNGNPKVALHIENEIRWGMKRYAKYHPDHPLPTITPHVLRHTFCTGMANAGLDIKSLQYFMGHSDVSTTLNIYTHVNYERAVEQFDKIARVHRGLEEKQLNAEM